VFECAIQLIWLGDDSEYKGSTSRSVAVTVATVIVAGVLVQVDDQRPVGYKSTSCRLPLPQLADWLDILLCCGETGQQALCYGAWSRPMHAWRQ
jgi:hypothetical protein